MFYCHSSSDTFSAVIPEDFRLAAEKWAWFAKFPLFLKGDVPWWVMISSLGGGATKFPELPNKGYPKKFLKFNPLVPKLPT